jgi:Inner membrane component of T3SS, cytoplasmic domain
MTDQPDRIIAGVSGATGTVYAVRALNISALRTPAAHTAPTKVLRRAPDSAVSRVEELPAGSALLVVKRGPNAGSRFLLDQPVTAAGRHPGSDIFLDDVTVSRQHAEFRWENDEFQVVDLGSRPPDLAPRSAADRRQICSAATVLTRRDKRNRSEHAESGG